LLSYVAQEIQESIAVKMELALGASEHIVQAGKLILACLQSGGKLIAFGNGGSAADAQHLATEFVGRYRAERQALAAIALTTPVYFRSRPAMDSSALTAISNDYGFEQVFSRQLEAIWKAPGCSSCTFYQRKLFQCTASPGIREELGHGYDRPFGKERGKILGLVDICLCVPSN
jgi:D-sedoheptulose 7-phosphate isomerase